MKILTRQRFIGFVYVLIDILCLATVFYVAALIRAEETLGFKVTIDNLFFDPINPYRSLFLFWVIVVVIVNNSFGLYQTHREIYEAIEVFKVIRSTIIASLVVIVAIYIVKIENFPRTILILVSILSVVVFSLWRVLKRIIVHYLVSRGYNNFNVIIVGVGKEAQILAKEINKRPGLGFNILGFLDNNEKGEENSALHILGKVSDFRHIAQREFIHQLFVTNHYDNQTFTHLVGQAKELGVAVKVVPYGYEFMSGDTVKYNIGIIPILEYSQITYGNKQIGKRIFDLLMTFFILTGLLPLLIMIAVLVKLDSPGPIFYKSRRYGRRGRIFHMYKFRSMYCGSDARQKEYQRMNEKDGPIFKIRNDPRITKIGKILRKYSLDELPQIVNVLKGDMSLVGPRPLPIDQIEKEDLKQLKRLEVRPGITGLWQIKGRSDVSFSRMVGWDVWYINNWSLWLDLSILIQTLPVVVKAKGAY